MICYVCGAVIENRKLAKYLGKGVWRCNRKECQPGSVSYRKKGLVKEEFVHCMEKKN
jgi:hypothetical protein